MSNDQLRWHLLRETIEILMKKLKRRDAAPLCNLLMSGKGPANAVRLIVSQSIKLKKTDKNKCDIRMVHNKKRYYIKSVHFQKLALRWAQFWHLWNRTRHGSTVMPEYVITLRDFNSIEKLRFDEFSDCLEEAIAIIDACPKLVCLVADRMLFSLLFKDVNVHITRIRSIEIKNFNFVYDLSLKEFPDNTSALERGFDDRLRRKMSGLERRFKALAQGKLFFELLADHPERCPLLESLALSTDRLFGISQSLVGHSITTVKSLHLVINYKLLICRFDPIDFSPVKWIAKAFPNVKNVSVTLTMYYEHAETMELIQAFEDFDFDFEFDFNCNLELFQYTETLADIEKFHEELQPGIADFGPVDSIVENYDSRVYTITKLQSNKTLTMRLKVWHCTGGYHGDDELYLLSDETMPTSDDDSDLDSVKCFFITDNALGPTPSLHDTDDGSDGDSNGSLSSDDGSP